MSLLSFANTIHKHPPGVTINQKRCLSDVMSACQGKKVLITGAAGYAGRALIHQLNHYGIKTTGIDVHRAPEDNDNHNSFVGSIQCEKPLAQALEGVDFVIHCATCRDFENPDRIYRENVDGLQSLLKAMAQGGKQHLIYLSTSAVYGLEKRAGGKETDQVHPYEPYGYSKRAAELLAIDHPTINTTILRVACIVGRERAGIFLFLFAFIKAGWPIATIGLGNNHIQFIHVDDFVEGVLRALSHAISRKINVIYNLGGPSNSSVRDDLQRLLKHANTGSRLWSLPTLPTKLILRLLAKLRLLPLNRWVWETADHDNFMDHTGLKHALQWSPKRDNASALISAYNWFRLHGTDISEGRNRRQQPKSFLLRLLRRKSRQEK